MNNHLREAIFNEFLKLVKNKVNYIYILIILATVISSSFGIRLIENINSSNMGYSYLLFSLQTLSNTILPIMLLLFAASMVSSEKTTGTIRNILVSGCSKTQFIISKIIISFIFQLVLMALAAITAIVIGYVLFGFGTIIEDGFLIMTEFQFWTQFFISYILLAIVLFAAVSFGIMISTVAQNNISAITIAIGAYILLEGTKTKLHIENFIYSSYIEFPLNIISELLEGFRSSWAPGLYHYLLVSTFWITISLFTSFLVAKKCEFK